ncbi:MAG: hypothetical protein ACKVVT_16875 [Dehalococcoidia bacterium]
MNGRGRSIAIGLFATAAFVTGACGQGSDERQTPVPAGTPTAAQVSPTPPPSTPSPTTVTPAAAAPTPTTPAGLYAPGTRTGVPVVDRALAAIETRDPKTLQTAFRYQPVPCNNDATTGFPPCPAGAAQGTRVDAVLTAQCHLGWVSKELPIIQAEIDVFSSNGPYLRSVAKIRPTGKP